MKARARGAADGPAFLNVLTDCPLGWGHEPRLAPAIVDAAVESCFWPLYEVVDGRYRLTYRPETKCPVEEWLGRRSASRTCSPATAAAVLEEIQRRVDAEWDELLARCDAE